MEQEKLIKPEVALKQKIKEEIKEIAKGKNKIFAEEAYSGILREWSLATFLRNITLYYVLCEITDLIQLPSDCRKDVSAA